MPTLSDREIFGKISGARKAYCAPLRRTKKRMVSVDFSKKTSDEVCLANFAMEEV